MGQTISSVCLTTSSGSSSTSSTLTRVSWRAMRATVLLLACFLFSVLCEMEENQDQALSKINSNQILVRNLREAEGKQKGKKGAKRTKSGKKRRGSKKGRNKNGGKKIRKQKGGKKQRNSKKGRNKKGGKKRRNQTNGKKGKGKRKSSNPKGSPRQTATCNGTSLGSTCLTNVTSSLKYERDNIANFMNQKARAEDFKKLMGNKGSKNDSFSNSTTYLLSALGGNVSNLVCSSSNSSSAAAITTYKALSNCSDAVGTACTLPNTTVNFTQLDTCKTYYDGVQKTNAKCFTMTMKNKANGTAVCECWKSAAAAVESAKLKKDSCSANTAQSDMKSLKNACLAAYGVCKKAEDASVSFILKCSGGGTSSSSNSTSSSSPNATSSSGSNSTNSTTGGRAARLSL